MPTSQLQDQLLILYKPATFSELKFFLNDLTSRVADFDQSLPGISKPLFATVSALFAEACDMRVYVKDVASRMGIDVDAVVKIDNEDIPIWDWQCITYPSFEAEAATASAAILAECPQFGTLYLQGFVNAIGPPEEARGILAKILTLFGVKEAYQAIIEILEAEQAALMEQIGQAARSRNWTLLRKLLKQLLDYIISNAFYQKLKDKVGEGVARKILGKILARFLPVIGWVVLIGSLIWAIAEEFI